MALLCRYCGQVHDRHEDAYCGCSCGGEPMNCAECMREGGPMTHESKKKGYTLVDNDTNGVYPDVDLTEVDLIPGQDF